MFSLNLAACQDLLTRALDEDLGHGDLTANACVSTEASARARVIARQDLILCGLPLAEAVFCRLDPQCHVESSVGEGACVRVDQEILRLDGRARALLSGERTALNFLQHLSGITTLTRAYVEAVAGTSARIVDTRKTTPGLRLLEKYAVTVGGGANHRFGLFDGVLIKENHIRAAGSIAKAIAACRTHAHHLCRIEIEVTTLEELEEALVCKPDVVMLDNFTPEMAAAAVKQTQGRALLEASGGMSLGTVRAFAEAGVDLISVGRLTHSAPAADMSLLFET